MIKYDFVIIGAGVIGLSVALELKKRKPQYKIAILEKEENVGAHASGRNSGVLHAGFYYTADSLKAKFTRQGNQYLKEYCEKKKLRINNCGKLVVTKNEDDLKSLDELFARAKKNEVDFYDYSLEQARKIEPRVLTFKRAGWSPNTSVVDPNEVLKSLVSDALGLGIEITYNVKYQEYNGKQLVTTNGIVEADFYINTAGLYADKIAKDFGFSKDFTILPFKGLYLKCTASDKKLNTNIYPVPNLNNPFLGVHHTLTVDGFSKIGPTAIPAFWREQYSGFDRFDFSEFFSITKSEIGLFFGSNPTFRNLAFEEIKKYNKKKLIQDSALQVSDVKTEDYGLWSKPGIRAQLLNTKTKKLEMDFKIEGDSKSLHVLNAVSPAFTCSQPFSEYICNLIGQNIKI